jgi:hypothetical protein
VKHLGYCCNRWALGQGFQMKTSWNQVNTCNEGFHTKILYTIQQS